MGLRLFSKPVQPVVISFGASSLKLLQLEDSEARRIAAAAELPIPEFALASRDDLFTFFELELPKLLKAAGFRGRDAVLCVPSSQTVIQHMQIMPQEGIKPDALVQSNLQMNLGIAPGSAVIRSVDVAELTRGGQMRREVICFAIPRELVLRYVELLKTCRMNVRSVHTESLATVEAFSHVQQSAKDAATMYVDLGWGGTRVTIAHGRNLVFARSIQIGGRTFDSTISKTLECSLSDARVLRLAVQDHHELPAPSPAAVPVGGDDDTRKSASHSPRSGHSGGSGLELVDFSELLETIADELSMCVRYHRGLFPDRAIAQLILTGGEARQAWLCRHVVRTLQLPTKLGDPLKSLSSATGSTTFTGLDLNEPQPGWTVPCGVAGLAA